MKLPYKNTVLLPFLASLSFIFSSCSATLDNYLSYHAGTNNVRKFTSPSGGKEMVFMPMSHIGPQEFYDNIKSYIDSLRDEGYTVFYESILYIPSRYDSLTKAMPDKNIPELAEEFPPTTEDKEELFALLRKYRKIVGYFVPPDYSDTVYKSTPQKSFAWNKKYVGQTKERLGITGSDIRADLTVTAMIKGAEERYGEIPLNDYDLKTELNEKFRPRGKNKTWNKKKREEIDSYLQTLRNDNLVAMVTDSEYSRIVVIYGKAHLHAVQRRLLEMGWKESPIQQKFYKYY